MLDKVLDKLGIYDILAILLSGMVIVTITSLLLSNIYEIKITNYGIDMNNTFLFLLISYFVGLIFQELGSLFQEIIHKLIKNKSLAMYKIEKHWENEKYPNQKSYKCITKSEFRILREQLKRENFDSSKWDDNTIYYYCKHYNRKENSILLEKLQSLGGMSRSFAVYFLFVFILSVINCFFLVFQHNISVLHLLVPLLALSLFFLFYFRFTRFNMMRYTKIFRDYLYTNVQAKSDLLKQNII